jgi:NAD-dependent SIR2 family protein deacetylase
MENILVITGAGVSVESGIQPFRGKSGIWEGNNLTKEQYYVITGRTKLVKNDN